NEPAHPGPWDRKSWLAGRPSPAQLTYRVAHRMGWAALFLQWAGLARPTKIMSCASRPAARDGLA
ncbi:hypothetical protein TorRG33x02_166270, partial [Trema orientale]